MSDHPLATRSGIPDELAYLRATYAREGWRTHANYGQLADFWLHVHDSLRGEGKALAQATADYREGQMDLAAYHRQFAPNLSHFLQHLNAHHQIEDRHYFPRFQALDPRMVAGFALLDRDHHLIHEALVASAESANRLIATFGGDNDDGRRAADDYAASADRLLALLMRHLADEEELVIPALLHHGERSVD
ncbi:hemerythrin domain-containing protein [Sphingomonas piscis]|uniref:Hemerythrin domain-containing protein n=1 Tax=Sphingomonas piscis TaxID=2714943 RepID=A0A6G7YM91_9SPHN|nr:hemerythrin domain-containing protein [Sphingomonas piscis]QIK77858.1 hemerythrin domain-containing protein [Sphingomonas piscis]